ncbi:MAG TPA: hypothetical protein VKU82_04095 [Planctomycetaceae bacterium]|nr:hypothetical protein [Planctomycetaceae bacterium]
MNLIFQCPACGQSRRASISAETTAIACEACHWSRPLPEHDQARVELPTCVVCGCRDLWRQKDFPQRLGVAMVVVGAVLSSIAWAYYLPEAALGVLLAFALVDLALFALMKDVLVCYRCQARYRDAVLSDDHPRFNLETAERYRQEAARLKDSRQAAPSGP